MGDHSFDYDYAIIGSGFGGSVAALRLAEKGYRVAVIEQGRHWTPDTLPATTWSLRRWLWLPALGLRGFFAMKLFRHVMVLHGNAVGGGSITYAATLLEPPAHVWDSGGWAGLADWHRVMPAHFATAKRMLGVTTNRRPGPADERLRQMAACAGVADSFRPTEVGLFFGPPGDDTPGKRHPDPFFGGEGPDRHACTGCGGCMIGCRFGAKNTLDQNYLYLAEKRGARILAETRVTRLHPLGAQKGAGGYALHLRGTHGGMVRARGVVVAASSLGTQELLLRMRDQGDLPDLSSRLGQHVRTNAESLIGLRFPGSPVDLSRGVAIGSGIHLPGGTHIEATRYPAGSDAMGLLTTLMARNGAAWLRALAGALIRQPRATLRLLRPRGWAREVMIFLCMQTHEAELTMHRRRRWFWPFARQLSSTGAPIPSHIPEATAFARSAAQEMGGRAMASLNEVFLQIPMTAHCIGGATMGRDRDSGVCDAQGRVFGYENLLICDGSVLSANLGVNPSLTITALAEHCMSHLPEAPAHGQSAD